MPLYDRPLVFSALAALVITIPLLALAYMLHALFIIVLLRDYTPEPDIYIQLAVAVALYLTTFYIISSKARAFNAPMPQNRSRTLTPMGIPYPRRLNCQGWC